MLHREIEQVNLGDVTVQAIDAETKEPLVTIFHGAPSGMDQRWPKAFSIAPTGGGDLSKLALQWIDIGLVETAVSAEAYERVPLKLDATTPRKIVIPLRRLEHAE